MFGEFNLICPTMFFAAQYASIVPKPNRYYSYRLVQSVEGGYNGCEQWMNVCHAMDLYYVFGIPLTGYVHSVNERDYQLSVDMIGAWTEFVKSGHPGAMGTTEWKPAFGDGELKATLATLETMILDVGQFRMDKGIFAHNCDGLWRSILFKK